MEGFSQPSMQRACSLFGLGVLLAILTPALAAQCGNVWMSGSGCVGTNGIVEELTRWDPDGAGPSPEVLVVAGSFSYADATACPSIAVLDPVTSVWTPLLPWFGRVTALTVLPSGELAVAGERVHTGAHSVATWDGNAWSSVGFFDGAVQSLAVDNNGDLVAGGSFVTANGTVTNGIARWNGATWQGYGLGLGHLTSSQHSVHALAIMPNGDVIAGGDFELADGLLVNNVARFDGVAWVALGIGLPTEVLGLAVRTTGQLVAAGEFVLGGESGLASWNGSAWVGELSGTDYAISAVAAGASGELLIGGWQDAGQSSSASSSFVARVSAAGVVTTLGGPFPFDLSGFQKPHALLELANGEVMVGGYLLRTLSSDLGGISRFDGSAWQPIGKGLGRQLECVAELPNGDVVVGGWIRGGIAVQTASGWQPLGGGVSNASPSQYEVVFDLVVMPNGDLLASGSFTSAGGVPVNGIARWDGTSWSALPGSSVVQSITDMMVLQNGNLFAAGAFQFPGLTPNEFATWDGASWTPVGLPTLVAPQVVAQMPNGDLFAGGYELYKLVGFVWTSVGKPTFQAGVIRSLAARGASLMVASDDYVWSYAGNTWVGTVAAPGGPVNALQSLPGSSQELLIGGQFPQTGNVVRLLGGTAGSVPIGSGLAGTPVAGYSHVQGTALAANGDVLLVGYFFSAGGIGSGYFARLSTSCPASVSSAGTGCAGSGGNNILSATSLPWTGGQFTSRATGMPGSGLALSVRGLSTISMPLSAILPQGLPGCSLLVTPDLLDVFVTSGVPLAIAFTIPNSVIFAGQMMHQQVVPLELGPQGNITGISSTNRLSLTIGTF